MVDKTIKMVYYVIASQNFGFNSQKTGVKGMENKQFKPDMQKYMRYDVYYDVDLLLDAVHYYITKSIPYLVIPQIREDNNANGKKFFCGLSMSYILVATTFHLSNDGEVSDIEEKPKTTLV